MSLYKKSSTSFYETSLDESGRVSSDQKEKFRLMRTCINRSIKTWLSPAHLHDKMNAQAERIPQS